MTKLIWINSHLLFKISNRYSTQYLCYCSEDYRDELSMEIGDIVFMKDTTNVNKYRILGEIRAIDRRKIIIGKMDDIGTLTKSKIEQLYNI